MAKRYDVAVKIVSQKGNCGAQHEVGDEWVIGDKTPEGMCLFALNALWPFAVALMVGGTFPWEAAPDVATVACPDAENPVVFELRRLQQ